MEEESKKPEFALSLNERGMVVIEDENLLELISGAAAAPTPAPAPPSGGTNYVCPNGNSFCPGNGAGNVCTPPRPPAPAPAPTPGRPIPPPPPKMEE